MTLGKIFNNIESARKCYLEKIMGVLTQCIDVQEVDKERYLKTLNIKIEDT
mgnify:CR=1